jgi:hypothetical protein
MGIPEDMHSGINTHLCCRLNIMKMKRRWRRSRRRKKKQKLGYVMSRGNIATLTNKV